MRGHARSLTGMLCVAVCAVIPAQASALLIYISPPAVQNSEFAGATVATFDSLAPGNVTTSYASSIGTYNATASAPFHVNAADQYGGATDPTNPSTPTNYFVLGSQSGTSTTVSVTLKQPADYLGFWWSAGDANNGVSFYSGNLLLGRFTTQLLLTLLNGGVGQVTAINQTKYNTSAYYGNPNAPAGRNTGEPYFFVDVVTSGTTFDKVIFDNSGTTSTGFESDNHTVSSAPVTLSGDHVFAGSINITTPEPPAPWLLGAGLALIALARWRRGGPRQPL